MLRIKIHIYSKAKSRFPFLDCNLMFKELVLIFECILLSSSHFLKFTTDFLSPESSRKQQKRLVLLQHGMNNSYSSIFSFLQCRAFGNNELKMSLMETCDIAVFSRIKGTGTFLSSSNTDRPCVCP